MLRQNTYRKSLATITSNGGIIELFILNVRNPVLNGKCFSTTRKSQGIHLDWQIPGSKVSLTGTKLIQFARVSQR